MPNTLAALPSNQYATTFSLVFGKKRELRYDFRWPPDEYMLVTACEIHRGLDLKDRIDLGDAAGVS